MDGLLMRLHELNGKLRPSEIKKSQMFLWLTIEIYIYIYTFWLVWFVSLTLSSSMLKLWPQASLPCCFHWVCPTILWSTFSTALTSADTHRQETTQHEPETRVRAFFCSSNSAQNSITSAIKRHYSKLMYDHSQDSSSALLVLPLVLRTDRPALTFRDFPSEKPEVPVTRPRPGMDSIRSWQPIRHTSNRPETQSNNFSGTRSGTRSHLSEGGNVTATCQTGGFEEGGHVGQRWRVRRLFRCSAGRVSSWLKFLFNGGTSGVVLREFIQASLQRQTQQLHLLTRLLHPPMSLWNEDKLWSHHPSFFFCCLPHLNIYVTPKLPSTE